MDYIVSPWLVYWMEVANSLCIANAIFFVILAIGIIVCLATWTTGDIEDIRKSRVIFVVILFFISLLIGIFLPSKETMIQMLVAKNLTYTNAGKIVAEGKNLKDELKKDVIDIILAVKDKK